MPVVHVRLVFDEVGRPHGLADVVRRASRYGAQGLVETALLSFQAMPTVVQLARLARRLDVDIVHTNGLKAHLLGGLARSALDTGQQILGRHAFEVAFRGGGIHRNEPGIRPDPDFVEPRLKWCKKASLPGAQVSESLSVAVGIDDGRRSWEFTAFSRSLISFKLRLDKYSSASWTL